jgi:hypothetical protein
MRCQEEGERWRRRAHDQRRGDVRARCVAAGTRERAREQVRVLRVSGWVE